MIKKLTLLFMLITTMSYGASSIDVTIPRAGNTLTSELRANWTAAKSEIEALQLGATANVHAFDCDGTDDAVVAAAFAAAGDGDTILFPNETCTIASGGLTIPTAKDLTIKGVGTAGNTSILQCSDATATACLEKGAGYVVGLRIENLKVLGPGKAAAGTTHGIYIHDLTTDSNNIVLSNVMTDGFSGNGIYMPNTVFEWRFSEVSNRNIAGNGFEGTCGQTCIWTNTGIFNYNITGAAIRIYDGNPEIIGMNNANVGYGGWFGRTLAQGGVAYSRPKIVGMNIEPMQTGGYGLYFEAGSSATTVEGLNLYKPVNDGVIDLVGGQATSGIYWDSLTHVTRILEPVGLKTGTTADFSGYIYDGNAGAGGSLFIDSSTDYDDGVEMSASIGAIYAGQYVTADKLTINKAVSGKGFTNSGGGVFDEVVTITSVDSPYAITDQTTQHVILVDASGGNISVTLDAVAGAGSMPDREFIIKRIDTDNTKTVELTTYGAQTIDGVNDPKLPIHGVARIVSDGSNWKTIGQGLFTLDASSNATFDKSITAAGFSGPLAGNADTATALASDPSDCAANQFANTIAANGNLTCAAIADADVPNTITIDLATTATNATNSAITNDTTTNAAMYPAWVTTNTGNLPLYVSSTNFTFNPSTGLVTATGFVGNVTGDISGNAGTATTATEATNVTAVDSGGATTLYPVMVDGATGQQAPMTDAGFTFNGTTDSPTFAGTVISASAQIGALVYSSNDSSSTPVAPTRSTKKWFFTKQLADDSDGAPDLINGSFTIDSCDSATPTVFTFTASHGFGTGQMITIGATLADCGITQNDDLYICSTPAGTTATLDNDPACGSTIGGQTGSTTDVAVTAVPDGITLPTPTTHAKVNCFVHGTAIIECGYIFDESANGDEMSQVAVGGVDTCSDDAYNNDDIVFDDVGTSMVVVNALGQKETITCEMTYD